MVRKSTPHAHMDLVDGHSTAREMIASAKAKGFYSLGFSEHARQKFDHRYGMSVESESFYKDIIGRLSRETDDLIVVLGLELDEFGVCDTEDYSYIIGSKHYMANSDLTDFFAVDGDYETICKGCGRFFGGDWLKLGKTYFGQLADYICRVKPEIVGHFDLVSKLNEKNGMFDANDAGYLKAGFEALERIAAVNPLLEINTGAMARGYTTRPYPAIPFLKRWKELGGEIILSTDCHDAEKIDYALDDANRLALAAGYESAFCLSSRDGRFEGYKL